MTSSDNRIYCRYQVGDRISYGVVEGTSVIELDGDLFGRHSQTSTIHQLADVKLLTPTAPRTFFCAGRNYGGHIGQLATVDAGSSNKKPVSAPTSPEIGYRSNTALIAHEEDIIKPSDAGEEFQYEGELVAVFGRRGKRIPRERALEYIFGWTIGNDVTERTWQATDRTMWRSKNSDTFKPMGPWIVRGANLEDMVTTVRVNGNITDQFQTADMLFDVATYISEITRYITVEPGDVLWLGTDGVPPNLQSGDVVEIEISGIGVLRNRVIAETRDDSSVVEAS